MKTQSGKIRIISGKYKGRILLFPAVEHLRPTPERIRETLFNWLAAYVNTSHCLDVFAGSGALGFEAASRGALSVTFIESNRKAARSLAQNIDKLRLENVSVYRQDSIQYLSRCSEQFSIILLDPPYRTGLLQKSIHLIGEKDLIKPNGWIYLEFCSHEPPPVCPAAWELFRTTTAGDVQAILYTIPG